MKREYTALELQAHILWKLYEGGNWSEKYTNYDEFKRRLSIVIKNNGKNVNRQVRELIKLRLVLSRKNARTISVNPYAMLTIKNLIREQLGFEL
ncbi:MAG: hypothetical protein IIA82_10710 [Thaumarchaeota archaeon]|nr:hypothetical protein [Nitrososphaerota archaeon]